MIIRLLLPITALLLIISAPVEGSLNSKRLNETQEFPEVHLETGSDSDHSYAAIRTVRQPNGDLKILVTGWGIREYGLGLAKQVRGSTLELRIFGKCGTVNSRTWSKESFSYSLAKEVEETISQISFRGLEIKKAPR
jgi:hypothetical protein